MKKYTIKLDPKLAEIVELLAEKCNEPVDEMIVVLIMAGANNLQEYLMMSPSEKLKYLAS